MRTCCCKSFSRDLTTEMRQSEWRSDTFKGSEVAVHHRWLTRPCSWVRTQDGGKDLDEAYRNGKSRDKPVATSLLGDERMWEGRGKLDTVHLGNPNR